MEEKSLWWTKDQDKLDLHELIHPLTPSQIFFLRIQARDALEAAFSLPDKVRPEQKCSESESIEKLDWKKISDIVNAKCPDSPSHDESVYRRVWMKVWLTNESTVFIHDEKLVYEILPKMVPDHWFKFYNLGYEYLEKESPKLNLDIEYWKYSTQLYHHMGSKVDITGADVVEVGCGRGGGASFLAAHFKPKTYVGIDVSRGNVEFCRTHHKYPGLSFHRADAIDLSLLKDESCDVVLNVESSHSYTSMQKFLSEVKRILRPGGYFCFTDSRHSKEIDNMRQDLLSNGLKLIEETDISQNVAVALSLFEPNIPKMLDAMGASGDKRNAYTQLMTDLCTRWYPHFSTKKYTYLSCTLQKER
jgi:ubiquinone/menaquinone biosynthesis C-methylase UbiE